MRNTPTTAEMRSLFERAPQPMLIADAGTGRILRVNEAALELYGYSPEEFLDIAVAQLEAKPRIAPTGAARRVRHNIKGGGLVDVELKTSRVKWGGREADLLVVSEVGHRRQWEDRITQAERMAAVGLLAGGVAHDFNNLLTIITGYSQILLSTMTEGDTNRAAVEQILKASDRAASLTRQLLAFSRKQKVQPKIIDLNALVQGMSTMLRRLIGEDIELHVGLAPNAAKVSADPGQIEQVIMNLAVNSRDAMPEGGTLTIETRNVVLDEEYAANHMGVTPGPYVLLSVSDNGTGMDQETRLRLFEPFFTTKAPGRGTGLGMSTVFGIVKQSGGNVEVYSEPGSGTSVKTYLPLVEAESANLEKKDEAAHQHGRGSETILLVEDEEAVRLLVRKTLERQGYHVLDAPNAKEARRITREHRGPLHLLITDVVMPQESGRQLAEWIVTARPEIKVLYMSGYTDHAIVNNNVISADVAFIQKPFAPSALARKVREVLEGNQPKRLHA
jgi:PAS domain S-box-containing protein